MSTESVFRYGSRNLVAIKMNDQPYFKAIDVCNLLGLSNHKVAIKSLDEDERGKFNLPRQGDTWFVNESGLYHLIFKSRKEEAARFRKWVTSEVLPRIRQQGSYGSPDVVTALRDQMRANSREIQRLNDRRYTLKDKNKRIMSTLRMLGATNHHQLTGGAL